jgi:hypothetical protein
MDWNQVLGWGSPIGLGVFLGGLGMLLRCMMHMRKMRHWDKMSSNSN